MKKRIRVLGWILCGALLAGVGAGARGFAQQHPEAKATPAATAPLTDQEVADTQAQMLKLLRLSPTLTSVVARDPSLLADQAYVERNNPELAQFLDAHPQVVQNPDFYLFSTLIQGHGPRAEALQRAVWPEFAQEPPRGTNGAAEVLDKFIPMVALVSVFGALVWIIRLFADSHRWSRTFKMQSEVHSRLIDKFSASQDLAAYMETEAGKRFLEATQASMGAGNGRHMPNVVARVLTPLQVGIVMSLLGTGLLLLRHAGPGMDTPMLVLGTVALMPGIGFILSAGATWVLAHRLGLMPEKPAANDDTRATL